jgi:hypothetical protein
VVPRGLGFARTGRLDLSPLLTSKSCASGRRFLLYDTTCASICLQLQLVLLGIDCSNQMWAPVSYVLVLPHCALSIGSSSCFAFWSFSAPLDDASNAEKLSLTCEFFAVLVVLLLLTVICPDYESPRDEQLFLWAAVSKRSPFVATCSRKLIIYLLSCPLQYYEYFKELRWSTKRS